MADDDIEVVEEEGGGKSKMMIIIAVVVLALGGGAAMMFMGGGDEGASTDDEKTAEANKPEKKQPAIYHAVNDPFIVNFSKQSNGAATYLQIKLKLMARDQAVIDAVELHMPAIQHKTLLLLYGQKYDDLNGGTKPLQASILTLINDVLSEENVENELKAVYFSSFLMQ